MLKFVKYFILIITLFYWAISHFQSLYNLAGNIGVFPDDYRYGDLYRLSYLPYFKEKAIKCPANQNNNKKSNVHLYIIGDSFGEKSKMNYNNFASLNTTFVHWEKPTTISLDTSVKNILLLESVERSMKIHFKKQSNEIQTRISSKKLVENISEISFVESWINTFTKNTKATEERLWHTLLNYDFVLNFRELKAKIDLKLFDRKSANYNLSADNKQIFYFEEADINCPNSAFYKVSDKEVNKIVEVINNDLIHYKKAGFDQVYLSIIPNKVSILQSNLSDYNHLLERIQKHKSLYMATINTYDIYTKNPEGIYLKSDTHWTCQGSGIWQNLVNEIVSQY